MLQNKTNKIDNRDEGSIENNVFYMGYPTFPFEQNVAQKLQEEINVASLNAMSFQGLDKNLKKLNEQNQSGDCNGNDMDIPETELDNTDEAMGSEDEENNHYSLGGDNHNDLGENK
jgi:hypothetical protein